MATQITPNLVYKCQSPGMAEASIHVVSGSVKIYGSNVTKNDPDTNKLIVPTLDELVDTGDDTLTAGSIRLVSGLPEWFAFVGSGEVWIKMGVDPRILPGS